MREMNNLKKALQKKNLTLNSETQFKQNTGNKKNNTNHKKSALGIFIFIIIFLMLIVATGMMYLKLKEEMNKNKNYIRIIKNLEAKNDDLKDIINKKKRLIKEYQKDNKKLAYQNARLKRNRSSQDSYQPNVRNLHIKPSPAPRTYTKKTPTRKQSTKPTKKYHRYSGYSKLVSDSKIIRRSDNRFQSNENIYGIYKHRIIRHIKCNLKQNIYKVVDECKTYAPYSTDILYLSKSNVEDVKNFDTKTHMIECEYSQKHGLMHDCKVKLKTFSD